MSYCFVLRRRRRRSGLCAHVVDQQMGRLLGQVRTGLSIVRRECWCSIQRLDSTHSLFEWRVSLKLFHLSFFKLLYMNCFNFNSYISRNLQYIERDGSEFLYTLQSYPDWLQKKITLLKYFRDYMTQHLLKVNYTHSHSLSVFLFTHLCW